MSITSEKQKRYDPTNGGFSYYTLFHADKGERPEFADVGDIVEEFGEGGKAYVCSRDAKGRIKWTEDATWDRQTGGSASGGSELPPYDSEDEGRVLSVDKEGDLEWVTPSGGGAEKFVVTLTEDDGTWTADKTIAEIVAADAAGSVVEALIPAGDGVVISAPLLFASAAMCFFSASFDNEGGLTTVFAQGAHDNYDAWYSGSLTTIGLPSYSSINNGQLLGVDDGSLAWVDNYAPLIVTMTFDDPAEPTAFVGDKTYGEVFTAASAGIPCSIVLSASGTEVATPIVTAASSSGTITLFMYDPDSSSITSIQGSSNDYVTIAIS